MIIEVNTPKIVIGKFSVRRITFGLWCKYTIVGNVITFVIIFIAIFAEENDVEGRH